MAADPGANHAVVRRGLELLGAGDLDTLFEEVFHPDVDYMGDPDISALAGFPTEAKGRKDVRAVWEAFFSMFDEIKISEISLEEGDDDLVIGSAHMVTRGGSSEVPIDALFYGAWVVRDGRWRFMAAKLDREAMFAALEAWSER